MTIKVGGVYRKRYGRIYCVRSKYVAFSGEDRIPCRVTKSFFYFVFCQTSEEEKGLFYLRKCNDQTRY